MSGATEQEIVASCEAFKVGRVYTENEIRAICPRALMTKGGECLGYDFSRVNAQCFIAPMYVATAHPDLFLRTIFYFIPENNAWKLKGKIGGLSESPEKELPA